MTNKIFAAVLCALFGLVTVEAQAGHLFSKEERLQLLKSKYGGDKAKMKAANRRARAQCKQGKKPERRECMRRIMRAGG